MFEMMARCPSALGKKNTVLCLLQQCIVIIQPAAVINNRNQ